MASYDFFMAELERVKTTAERYFTETGNKTIAMLVCHTETDPIVSTVVRHVELINEDDESVLMKAVAEVCSLIPLTDADIVTLVLPEKLDNTPAISVLMFHNQECSLRKVTYGFKEDGEFIGWNDVEPEKAGDPDPIYMSMIAYLMRAKHAEPFLAEVMFTTLTKRGHNVYVVDDEWSSRWQSVQA